MYVGLFMLFLGYEADWFGSSSGSDDEAPEPDPDTENPLYIADDYTDEVQGTAEDDNLSADEQESLAWFLNAGNDTLDASTGNDYANAGAGDDHLMMREGDDIAIGGEGNDTIDAGIGHDIVLGGLGNDYIHGNGGQDSLAGQEGDDTVLGGTGSDEVYGGEGNDYLSGKDFDSSQNGHATMIDGFDSLFGGAGNDTLLMGAGDQGTGGEGDDLFQLDNREDGFGQISQVHDFGSGDQIELLYRPEYDTDGNEVAPNISVTANDEGTAGIIRFNDVVVAEVIGGQHLTTDDLVLKPESEDA
jgi:Ca2+-binding RTX toxin-like protein